MAKNITYEERYTIECMLDSNYSLKSICSCINRTYRTLKREISRCDSNKYIASEAHQNASKKMSRNQSFQLDKLTEEYIRKKLIDDKWSPMIISKSIEAAGFDQVSHTYIYSYIKKIKIMVVNYIRAYLTQINIKTRRNTKALSPIELA